MVIEELQKAYEDIPDGVAIIDKEGRFIYANQSCSKIFGYEIEDLLYRKRFGDLFSPIYIDNPAENNYLSYTEYDLIHKSGNIISVALTVTPIKCSPLKLAIFRDMKDINNAKKEGLNQIISFAEKNIALVKYGFDKLGPAPEVLVDGSFIQKSEHFLHKIGVHYLTTLQSAAGLYGPLPVLDFIDYLAVVYNYKEEEKNLKTSQNYYDERFDGKRPACIVIIFHKVLESLVVDRKRLLDLFEQTLTKREYKEGSVEIYEKMLKEIKKKLLIGSLDVRGDDTVEKKLHAINQMSRGYQNFTSIDEIFEKVGVLIEKVLKYDRFTAWYIDRTIMGFKLLLQKGYKPEVIEKIQLKITDRSIVSKTARLGATINLANVKDDPEYLEVNTDIKSELAVPILSPTTKVVIGVLNAESTIEGTYNAEDEIILEALAEKIAQFVHIEETNSRFLAMHNLLYEINSEEISELEDIFRYVVDFVDATFNYKLFAILLINKETNELEMKVHRGYEDPTISEFKVTIDTKKSFVAKCARENRTLNEGDVRKVDCYYEGDSNVLSELAVPITLDNEVIGVINVESTMVDGFSNIDERLLEMLSKILVMTIKTKIK